jgi:hypothetical protein
MDGWRTELARQGDEGHESDTSDDPPDQKLRCRTRADRLGREDVKPLPPPGTFAEGQRLVYGLLAAAAGMFCGAAAILMIALLMWGGWSPAEEHSIVLIFGWSLGGFIAAMVAVIVGLLAGGPVGRFKMSATKDGASFEADSEAQP